MVELGLPRVVPPTRKRRFGPLSIALMLASLTIVALIFAAWGRSIDIVNAAVATGAAVVSCLLFVTAAQQFVSLRRQTVSIFLEISDRWSNIYAARNAILASSPVTAQELAQRYGHDYGKLLESEEWAHVRPICNFFEIAGYILRERYIDRETLFMLVSVDAFESLDDGQQEGAMYIRLKGYIDYLRRVYHKRIYENYDGYLLVEYKKYVHSRR